MSKIRYGNPKKRSEFICLKCLRKGIAGIQRGGKQREKGHIKDLYCPFCNDTVPHLELRYCDYLDDVMERAKELHKEIFEETGNKKHEQILYT